MAAVAEAVQIPLLCKDFIIHEVQIDRAKEAGASVILLIVAALDITTLQRLHGYATSQGLEVLVEVHDAKELETALSINAKLIGVNNRDLRTFDVDLARTEEIAKHFPFNENHVFISESGIMNAEDAKRAAAAGASAILVGESLMRSASVEDSLRSLQVPKGRCAAMTKVKICGLMEPQHVQAAVEAGADAVGFVFAPSRRRVAIEQAKELARLVPDHVMKVGVFVDAEREELERTFREVPLDFIQYHGGESADFIKSVGLPSIKAIISAWK